MRPNTTLRRRAPAALLVPLAVAALALAGLPAAAQSPCGPAVTVSLGDTLYEIAQNCETTVEALVRDNEIIDDPNLIRVGWTLEVPPADPADRRPGRDMDPRPAPEPADGRVHVVERGDTLAEIAARYGLSLAAIVAANAIDDPNLIRIGQEILLPGREGDVRPPEPGPAPTRVAISPSAGPPGTPVTVTASGFPPGAQVHVGAGRAQSEYDVLERTAVDDQGRLRTTVELPAFADAREEWVFVVSTPDHRVEARSERFDVRPGEPGDDGDLVSVQGTVTGEGVECPVLRTSEGELYSLTGDLGDLGPGDRVRVEGTVAEVSICMQGTTLQVQALEPIG